MSGSYHIEHTIRHANSWQPFSDVTNQAGVIGAVELACAGINDELHVCAIANAHLYHTIRHANSWQAFGDVEAQANDIGNISDVACAAVNGELHVCAIAGGAIYTIQFVMQITGRLLETWKHKQTKKELKRKLRVRLLTVSCMFVL